MNTAKDSTTIVCQINHLKPVVNLLKNAVNDFGRLEILNQEPAVHAFIQGNANLQAFLGDLTPASEIIIKSIVAIGQGSLVFQQMDSFEDLHAKLHEMIDSLLPVEKFYHQLGGIVGYHLTVLELLGVKQGLPLTTESFESYSKPSGLDLCQKDTPIYRAIRAGIESLPSLAEIYPVGGAGDRLQLRDEETGEPLPVAQMRLCGLNLLEWLLRDLQAREYLYYKLVGEQILTPVAMMTSLEKNNHAHIVSICQAADWFGRSKKAFRFFTQPLVPVLSEEGNWCLSAPLTLIFKPGGHGVMWKLAETEGIFDWFEQQHRHKVLVRQINNPIAGIDSGLLAFTGVGFESDKAFGFASCFRLLKTAEGMNVLAEKRVEEGYAYAITNIEYTEFSQKGIEEAPVHEGSNYSAFPANTNILFADITAVRDAVAILALPGATLNMKSTFECLDEAGQIHSISGGRLESTMQNIADVITTTFSQPASAEDLTKLKTYLTYNERCKTISVTKKSYVAGQSIVETPEGCYYDLQLNAHDLLRNYCGMEVPEISDSIAFITEKPSFLVNLHPALGPLYDVIAFKIHGGKLHQGSDLTIEAAEVNLDGLTLQGSLHIDAKMSLGHTNVEGILEYGENSGKCTLKNVKVNNKGIDWSILQQWWKGNIRKNESLEIILHGNGEFFAENVTFNGGHCIEVPDGFRVEAVASKEGFRLIKTRIQSPTWFWKYSFTSDHRITLQYSINSR